MSTYLKVITGGSQSEIAGNMVDLFATIPGIVTTNDGITYSFTHTETGLVFSFPMTGTQTTVSFRVYGNGVLIANSGNISVSSGVNGKTMRLIILDNFISYGFTDRTIMVAVKINNVWYCLDAGTMAIYFISSGSQYGKCAYHSLLKNDTNGNILFIPLMIMSVDTTTIIATWTDKFNISSGVDGSIITDGTDLFYVMKYNSANYFFSFPIGSI